jgi:hypothetical protein
MFVLDLIERKDKEYVVCKHIYHVEIYQVETKDALTKDEFFEQ